MPGLVPGIHVFPWRLEKKDVDGWDEPGDCDHLGVIVRESGDDPVLRDVSVQSKSHGVLDTPPSRSMMP